MGSSDKPITLESVEQLRNLDWLTGGSLGRIFLPGFHQEKSNMIGAVFAWEQLLEAESLEDTIFPDGIIYRPEIIEDK